MRGLLLRLALLFLTGPRLVAGSASVPLGEPVLDPPTLHSLGLYWIIGGDDNRNGRVEVEYRRAGAAAWRTGPALFRVRKGEERPEKGEPLVRVPPEAWLFAGSVVLLEPDTAYELRLRLDDPDGGSATRLLECRTLAEPAVPAAARRRHVIPGEGGGSGTQEDPFRGLAAAEARAEPGDVFLLHAGVYQGTFTVKRSGEPGRPIVWRGAGDGEAVIDGQAGTPTRPSQTVMAVGVHDVWFELLTMRNAAHALAGNDSSRLVIRSCRVLGVDYGITLTRSRDGASSGFFISDNVIEGPSTWPRSKGIESARGIQVTGAGHVVCYNRIRGFADGIDTFPSARCLAIDFHNNDLSCMTDDGIELDFSERNTRAFRNRLTNVFQGISFQPVFGGPVYVFQNVLYNVALEPFKMHNSPSGALVLHNTCVKKGMPLALFTAEEVRNCVYRNNLFLGTPAPFAYETTAPMVECDFDYDGFGGGPWSSFLKWNGARYRTLEEVKKRAPVYRHAVLVDASSAFASGLGPPSDVTKVIEGAEIDLRLAAGTPAVDSGAILPGFNDGFAGRAPDLGAYELGSSPPHYGPRPGREPVMSPASNSSSPGDSGTLRKISQSSLMRSCCER